MKLFLGDTGVIAVATEALIAVVVSLYGAIVGIIWKLANHMSDKTIHGKVGDSQSAVACKVFQESIQRQVDQLDTRTGAAMQAMEDRLSTRMEEVKTDIVREVGGLRALIILGPEEDHDAH